MQNPLVIREKDEFNRNASLSPELFDNSRDDDFDAYLNLNKTAKIHQSNLNLDIPTRKLSKGI